MNTYCLRREFRPETKSSSASSLINLETKSSTNWSSFTGFDDPFDDEDVEEDEDEQGNEPVIMADVFVMFLNLSSSANSKKMTLKELNFEKSKKC